MKASAFFLSFVLFASISMFPAAAAAPSGGIAAISDDASLREELVPTLFRAPIADALRFKTERRELPDGSRVEVRVERGRSELIAALAREGEGGFDLSVPGGWALYRRLSDGEPTRVRIFPSSDPHCYIQLRPDRGGRTLMDAVVYGGYVGRSLALPLSFDRAVVEPFRSLLALAGPAFPRRFFEPRPEDYADLRAFAAAVRSRLGELSYADDGALDERGRPVSIATLSPRVDGALGVNCSGFAKWLVDGIIRPLGSERLSIPPLKTPPVARGNSFSEPYEALRDPYFGLDWTRNLAAAAGRAFYGARGADPREYEVVSSPIASFRISGGDGSTALAYPSYLKDSGFPFEGLKAILYALAVEDPGRLYLASINRDIGSDPRLRQHYHVAALLPLFDEAGRFSVLVFESAVESGYDAFAARYPGHLAHLVRVPVEGSFAP